MSVEGGAFPCSCGFRTESIDEWNKHCGKIEKSGITHRTEEGVAICQGCGDYIQFSGLPFHPLAKDGSKNIRLTCDECGNKAIKGVKIAKIAPMEGKKR